MNQYSKTRLFKLSCGILSFLVIGSLPYCWSLFVAPLEAEFGWTRAQTTVTYSIFGVAFLLGGLVDGYIGTKKSPRLSLLTASVLLTAGLLTCWSMTSLSMLYIGYGILCALGTGMLYNGWVTSIADWFPEKSSFIISILLVCYALSTTIMGGVYSTMLYSPLGWRKTFLCMAAGMGAVTFLTSAALTMPPDDYAAQAARQSVNFSGIELAPKQVFRTSAFWFQFIWLTLVAVGAALIGQSALIMSDAGAAVTLAAFATGLLSAGNAAGRLLLGILFYRIGRDRAMLMLGGYLALICALIAAAYSFRLPAVLALLFCLYGIGFGGVATFRASYMISVFGQKHFKRNMSYMSMLTVISAPIMNIIGVVKTRTGSYRIYLYLMIACAAAGVLITPMNVKAIRHIKGKYSVASPPD